MKAPFWGKCCGVVCVAVIGALVALQTTGVLRAADPQSPSALGPEITPLGRATDGSANALDYNSPAPGGVLPPNTLRQLPGMPAAPATTAAVAGSSVGTSAALSPATTPVALRAIDSKNLPLTADPLSGAPSNGTTPTITSDKIPESAKQLAPAGTTTETKASPWRPIQTAFKQFVEPRNSGTINAPPTPGSYDRRSNSNPYSGSMPMDQRLMSQGMPPTSSILSNNLARENSQTASSDSPASVQAPTVPVDPPTASEAMNGPYAPVRPGGPGSTCASCQGGGQCGLLPPGAGDCPTCGGWKPGSCKTCDPNGSCILQRLACCLTKPYPDCSNGCVDFCHSWIFHEDDFWLFSNHKCVAPGCGPYPYGGCPNDGMGKGIGCGCGNCGPCVPPPDLYIQMDALALTRDNDTGHQTIATGATALTTNDFDFDWRVGPAITAGYRPTRKDAWEVTYFGLQDWNETETLTGGGISLTGAIGLLPNFAGADTLSVNYSSEIHDGELNYLWKPYFCPDMMWLVGFRYFHLDEQFDMLSTVTGVGTGDYNTRTNNDLFGLQGGIRLQHRWCDRFCTDGFIKSGVYRNRAEQRQSIFNDDTGTITSLRNTSTQEDHWAYVCDAGCNLNYFICRNWCVTAGYNVIWADQLALAPNQLDFTNNPPISGTALDHGGSLFLHGAHLGVGCRW